MADKEKLASIFADIASWLELKGENPFKIRAYETAARVLEQMETDPAELVQSGKLEDVPGIGKVIGQKITEYITTGRMNFYDDLKASIAPVLFDLVKIPGLGPKKALVLYEKLQIHSIGELEYACRENRLLTLPGFGEKTQTKILAGIEYLRKFQGKFLLSDALPQAEAILKEIRALPEVTQAEIAGSLRRRKEIVGDVDIVVAATSSEPVMEKVLSLPTVSAVIGHGPTKISVTLKNGLNADIRVVAPDEFVYALHHFTGSKEHNVRLRTLAKERGLKINEYGIETADGKGIAVVDERGFFKVFGLDYIAPEMREGSGEIELAAAHALPELVTESDLRGAFHAHTLYSDGRVSLKEMKEAAKLLGWQYLGITDHSRTAAYARGLPIEKVMEQRLEIARLNEEDPSFSILNGIESDILPDGSLDYPDEVLAGFDFVIASVHSAFQMGREEMTRRITHAVNNQYVTMLGHPTGRLLLARDGYEVDLSEIIRAAGGTGTMIEINASPYRLDLDWRWLRQAKDQKVLLAINPDAHSREELSCVSFGVSVARKGWLTARNVVNSRSIEDVRKLLAQKRETGGLSRR